MAELLVEEQTRISRNRSGEEVGIGRMDGELDSGRVGADELFPKLGGSSSFGLEDSNLFDEGLAGDGSSRLKLFLET